MFDPDLLRTLLAVAETGSFTRAARRVHLTQATVSQQVRRMEEQVGRALFTRTTHAVALTADGEIMLGYARAILRTADDARRHFTRRQLATTIRLGVAEDYALCCLPRALATFQRAHPQVSLHVELGLSTDLFQRLDDGGFDLVLAKTLAGRAHGQFVLREPLVWVGAPGDHRRHQSRLTTIAAATAAGGDEPLPLALYPAPSVSRPLMLEALERVGRPWRVAYTSPSIAALRAAVLAGVAVSAFSRRLVPPGLRPLPPDLDLPALGEVSYFLDWRQDAHDPAIDVLARTLHEATGWHEDQIGGDFPFSPLAPEASGQT